MVSPLMFSGLIFTIICSLILPCVCWIILARKYKGVGIAGTLGLCGYFVPQMILMILMMFLSSDDGFAALLDDPVIYPVFSAVLTAAAETAGRVLVLKKVMKSDARFVSCFSAGLGHGTCEAMLSGGIMYIMNFSVCLMINMNSLPKDDNYVKMKEDILSIPISECFAAGVERLAVLFLQVALTVILAYFLYKSKKWVGILVSGAIQAVFIASVSFISLSGASVWIIVGSEAVFSAAACVFAWSKHGVFPKEAEKKNLYR